MKKVISTTIGKVVFNVEEDAYEKLDDYLESIRQHFSKNKSREEILEDIEISIAEKLLQKRENKDTAITLEDVSTIISQMGTVADFGKEEESDEEDSEEKEDNDDAGKTTKKLYRDPDDKIIAGVASGLAAYFGIETVLMRLIFFVTIFFGGIGVVAYIVLWIIMPEAKTTAQKFAMHGERVTLKQIEKSIKEEVQHLKKKDFGNFGTGINKFFMVLGKIVMVFLEVIRVIIGLAILLAGISGVFALSFGLAWMFMGGDIPWTDVVLGDFISVGPVVSWVFLVAVYLIVFVPMLILFLVGLTILRKKNMVHTGSIVVMLIFWFMACGVSGAVIFKNLERIEGKIEEMRIEEFSDKI